MLTLTSILLRLVTLSQQKTHSDECVFLICVLFIKAFIAEIECEVYRYHYKVQNIEKQDVPFRGDIRHIRRVHKL